MNKFMRILPLVLILCFGTACAPATSAAADSVVLPVIMYHSVLKSRSGDYIVPPSLLASDLDTLAARGYTTVTTRQLTEYCAGRAGLPKRPILMTFDDGNLNNLTYALPVYRDRNAHAVVSVVGAFTERAERENAHNVNFSSMTWSEIRRIAEGGVFEIGNHTYDMHKYSPRFGTGRLKGESDAEYAAAVRNDVDKMQRLLEANTGIRPVCFAYPFGKITDVARRAVESLGFSITLTCNEGVNRIRRGDPASLLSLKRYNRAPERNLDEMLR